MSDNTVNLLHDKDNELKSLSGQLSRMSSAFYETGNEIMGEKLSYIAEELYDSMDSLRESYNKEINQRLTDSLNFSGSLVSALASGDIKFKEATP